MIGRLFTPSLQMVRAGVSIHTISFSLTYSFLKFTRTLATEAALPVTLTGPSARYANAVYTIATEDKELAKVTSDLKVLPSV